MMKRLWIIFMLLCIGLPWSKLGYPSSSSDKKLPITIFYSRHCGACLKVENEYLPVILKKYGKYVKLIQKEINEQGNLEELMNYNERGSVPTIVVNGQVYVGVEAIETNLEKVIQDFIAGKLSPTKKQIQKKKQ